MARILFAPIWFAKENTIYDNISQKMEQDDWIVLNKLPAFLQDSEVQQLYYGNGSIHEGLDARQEEMQLMLLTLSAR